MNYFDNCFIRDKILNKIDSNDHMLYVLKGFGDFDIKQCNLEKLYDLNFEEIIDNCEIDIQKLMVDVLAKIATGKTFILSYEEFVACVDSFYVFYDTYKYNVTIIVNNLYHDYFPMPKVFECEEAYRQIAHEADLPMNRIYSETININDVRYIEYAGFDDKFNCEYVNIFDVEEDIDIKMLDEDDVLSLSFGMSEETYVQFLSDVLNLKEKVVYVSDDADSLLSYQKNLLKILFSLGYRVNYVKRRIRKHYDDKEDAYLEILKRKNEKYNFRNISFYKNPGFSLETEKVSQSEIISALTNNAEKAYLNEKYNDIFVTAPTGSGKSVLFQIPAIYLAEKYDLFTIIVSPLIGLMNDQVQNIKQMTNRAETINSDYTPQQKEEIKQKIIDKEISILYVSPETLLSNNPIANLIGERQIGLFVVDEAHIVSTWGKSFRPDYWFLGDYISYLRTKCGYRFPIATFSATITYGGNDDMHGDIVDSLKMKTGEYEYIAPMRRDDINFDINVVEEEGDYLKEKEEKVYESLQSLLKENRKTIAYFPFTSQVDTFDRKIKNNTLVGRYYSKINKSEKEATADNFKEGKIRMMLTTKAFGMGVDIDDIEVVYHYAPTGNLCDYVQEIGRAARSENIQGTAKIDFFSHDYRYIKQLFGMSSIKNYQILETLKKLKNIYEFSKKRNFTVSSDEFSYIFPNNYGMDDVDTSFKTVMLMIQKDFERNPHVNFKPVIFKPRSMFSLAYIMVKEEDLKKLKRTKFFRYFKEYSDRESMESRYTQNRKTTYLDHNDFEFKTVTSQCDVHVTYSGNIYMVDLKRMWEENFNDISFAHFKYSFYSGELPGMSFSKNFLPEYLLTINIKKQKDIKNFEDAILKLKNILDDLYNHFSSLGINEHHLTINEIADMFNDNKYISLNKYESKIAAESIIEIINKFEIKNKFNNRAVFKRNAATDKYTLESINLLKNKIQTILKTCESKFSSVKLADKRVFLLNLKLNKLINVSQEVLIAQLLEMFGLANYKVVSGERPEYFVRINSINQIERILNNEDYESEMVKLVKERHIQSIEIMNKFFLELKNDQERWDYIEKYFAGYDVEDLLKNE